MTLDDIIKILDTSLKVSNNGNKIEISIDKFDIADINHPNLHIALYAIEDSLQKAKETLSKRIEDRYLVRVRRFEGDICPIYRMPKKIDS